MTAFSERVAANILPLSQSQTLNVAFKEWAVTDGMIDHEQAIEICELCNQEDLRYQYEIANRITRRTLWVGSSCILKFDVAVLEKGVLLSGKDRERKLNRLLTETRRRTCIASLERLAEAEKDERLIAALAYYRKHEHLTPKFAAMVLWRLSVAKIEHSPTFFKVCLRRDQHKRDLQSMRLQQVHTLWPALTSAQRQTAIALGHRPPPPPVLAPPAPPPSS